MTLAHDRLHAPGPKRILALDGGGTRGIVTIAFLERIEQVLAEATGRGSDFRLAEYFDLIGGTSVGSMLATMLAMGDSVAEVKERFVAWAPEIFNGRDTFLGVKRFDARQLANRVRGVVGDHTRLNTNNLRTGLAIVMKRVDTGAVWVLFNNRKLKYWPDGPANENNGHPKWAGNYNYNLAQLVRASTAAPYHFIPVSIEIGNAEHGLFVDGGVSPHNNPALLLFLMSTIDGYKLNWNVGADKLLIISVGTGYHRVRIDRTRKRLSGALFQLIGVLNKNVREDLEEAVFAMDTLRSILADCDQLNVKILQGLSSPRLPWGINSELGDLSSELIGRGCVNDYLLSFQRYNLSLDKSLLDPPFGVNIPLDELPALHKIDQPDQMGRLYDLAKEVAQLQVSLEDFRRFLPNASAPMEPSAAPREPAMV